MAPPLGFGGSEYRIQWLSNVGIIIWVKLIQRGYKRSISGLYRVLKKQGIMAVKPPNPKYIPKPYEQMHYSGQRVQIDVKYVPSACLKNSKVIGKQFFQYTAIDEYSRWHYVEAFEEHNTYSYAVFLDHLLKAFPISIECVQTDNGTEFSKPLYFSQRQTYFV